MERLPATESSVGLMTDERVVFFLPEHGAGVPVEKVEGTEGLFRARLEASLDASYRLAAVILGDRREAEDVTHDALERAWRSRSALRELDRFDAWFQRIVVNACRDRMRRRRTSPPLLSVDSAGPAGLTEVLPSRAPDPFAATAQREALGQALAELSADQRVVVALRFYADLEIDEIARRLSARPGTIKSRLHRALRHLRAAWEAAERRELEVRR